MKTLITGSDGLVGRALSLMLRQVGHDVILVVRKANAPNKIEVGEINALTDWTSVLRTKPDSVVHLAAQMPANRSALDRLDSRYSEVNVLGTLNLAHQCADHGVKRLVFLSSVKVLGEGRKTAYSANDRAFPKDVYAESKWNAEKGLMEIALRTGLEVVILRPPLVYGPGVKVNFLNLIRAVDRGYLMPVKGINNKRSLIYVGNLVDAIRVCIEHPNAAFKTYLVSDGKDLSTAELIRLLAIALDRPNRAFYIPPGFLRVAGKLLGKTSILDRLMGSLTVECSAIKSDLGWLPPFSIEEGLAETIKWYRELYYQSPFRTLRP